MLYETEEQQIEAIKSWWLENGSSTLTGIVIGFMAVLGWQAWVNHRNAVAIEASTLFEQLTTSIEVGKHKEAAQQTATLRSEFTSTPYAAFAELIDAKRLYEKGDIAGAKEALKQAIANAPESGLATVAVLRLARLYLNNKEWDNATDLLKQYPASAAFAAEYAAIRGDIAVAKSNIAEARRAYQEAVDGKAAHSDIIQFKLDNLPPLVQK